MMPESVGLKSLAKIRSSLPKGWRAAALIESRPESNPRPRPASTEYARSAQPVAAVGSPLSYLKYSVASSKHLSLRLLHKARFWRSGSQLGHRPHCSADALG